MERPPVVLGIGRIFNAGKAGPLPALRSKSWLGLPDLGHRRPGEGRRHAGLAGERLPGRSDDHALGRFLHDGLHEGKVATVVGLQHLGGI